MSEIATATVTLTDIEAVKALCKEKGWTFNEGATTFQGMGWKGECVHSIGGIKDCRYEIGIQKTAKGFGLSYDHYFESAYPSWNNGKAVTGKDAGLFMQAYTVCKIERDAKLKGLLTSRQYVQGTNKIQVVLAGM